MAIYINSAKSKRNYIPEKGNFGDNNFEITSELGINCVGYTIVNSDEPETCRPQGRRDYQLIFIKKGGGQFTIDKKVQFLNANTLILYRPKEPQKYNFYSDSQAEFYWIHFGGTEAEMLVNEMGFSNTSVLPYNNPQLFVDTINHIHHEMSNRKLLYKSSSTAKLLNLFVDIARSNEIKTKHSTNTVSAIESIRTEIEQTFFLDLSNDEYAEKCGMSTSYFLKCFKDATGLTPKQYRDNFRINSAKDLLLNSNYKIGAISQIVGFSDPLYFSRFFKKTVGMSPAEYRKQ